MKKSLIVFALFFPFLIAVATLYFNTNNDNESLKEINPFQSASLAVETFYIEGLGWGFDIFVDGKSFIHHEKIEGMDTKGYANEQDAVKVAHLVMYKIKRNHLPPLISLNELDSIGVKIN